MNKVLDAEGFDGFVEGRSAKFYAQKFGRPSLLPGISFRSLLIGYCEGIEGAAGCARDGCGLRQADKALWSDDGGADE